MASAVAKRSEKLDIVKGLAILYVVLGHSSVPFVSQLTSLFQPMFFFIAGYTFKDEYSAKPWVMVKKRTKSLYLPFIQYGLFFGILHNLLFSINIYTEEIPTQFNRVFYFHTTQEFLLNLVKILAFAKVEQIVAPMWFLPVLFIVNMLFLFISYGVYKLAPADKRDVWRSFVVAVVFILGFLFPLQNNFIMRPISIGMAVVCTYYFGFLFKKYEKVIPVNGFYAASLFMLLLISVQYGPLNTGGHYFVSPAFFLSTSLSAFYVSFYAASRMETGPAFVKNFMIVTGRRTIEIMSLHFLVFRLINYVQVRIYDLPLVMTASHPVLSARNGWWAVYVIFGTALPLIAKSLYERARGMVRPSREAAPY